MGRIWIKRNKPKWKTDGNDSHGHPMVNVRYKYFCSAHDVPLYDHGEPSTPIAAADPKAIAGED